MTDLIYEIADGIWQMLDNSSMSAFLGAFAAYLLVQLTDRRRITNDHSNIKRLVRTNQQQAKDKLAAVERNIVALSEQGQGIGSPFMRFAVDEIKALEMRVLNRMSAKEKLATDALCYQCNANDDLLDEATATAKELKDLIRQGASTQDRDRLGSKLVGDLRDAAVNLRVVEKITGWYINGDYSRILETEFDRRDFEG